jgi:Protein of unknown function (DUF3305)
MSPAPLERIPVGVVIERRTAKTQWADFVWRPVAVLFGTPETAPWTVLDQSGSATTIYAGAADVVLFTSSTAYYKDNLDSGEPSLWVVLRPTGVDPPFTVLAVTADPTEGEAFTQAGNDLVEPVPMPSPLRQALDAFVRGHHVDTTFVKRKRDEADPEALARRPPAAKSKTDD